MQEQRRAAKAAATVAPPPPPPLLRLRPSARRALHQLAQRLTRPGDPTPYLRFDLHSETDDATFDVEWQPAPADQIVDVDGLRILVSTRMVEDIRALVREAMVEKQQFYTRSGRPYDKPFDFDQPGGLVVAYVESRLQPGFAVEVQKPIRKRLTGQLARVDQEGCTGCLICYGVCPVEAIEIVPGPDYRRVNSVVEIDHDRCIGCRECVICPYGLIQVIPRAEAVEQAADARYRLRSIND